MGKYALVSEFTKCEFCDNPAYYYAVMFHIPVWAYMCEEHYYKYGCGLGLGKGHKLILIKESKNAI